MNRYRMLDLLRGVTVFLMIVAHSIYFFHNDTSAVLVFFEQFGNTVAFTVFLIVSAATAEIAYFSKEDLWIEKRKRLIRRVMVLAIGYLALAFMIFFAEISSTYGLDRIWLILDIVSFRNLAPFAEFYVPFMIFPLVIAVFPKFFRNILKSIPLAFLLGLAIYLLGMFYYRLPVWDFLLPWKALIFGSAGYYRFPIFQYFPIYLLGMMWGNRMLVAGSVKKQKQTSFNVAIISVVALVLVITTTVVTNSGYDGIINRWPPSIPFLLIGIIFASLVSWLFYVTGQLKRLPLLRDGILVLGQNALGLALIHVFLLQIYSLAGGLRTGSIIIYIFSLIVLLIISVALAAIIPFNFRFSLYLEKGSFTEQDLESETLVKFEEEIAEEAEKELGVFKRFFFIGRGTSHGPQKLIKKRHFLGVSILIVLAMLFTLFPVAEEYFDKREDSEQAYWDNSDFGWRQRLTVTNNESLAEIPKQGIVRWQFDHAGLVTAKKAYPDGRDLLLRYWDGKKFQSVDYWLSSESNQSSTSLSFKLKDRLKPGDNVSKYYLYYGNNLAENGTTNTQPSVTPAKHTIVSKGEETYPVLLTVDRRWSILSEDTTVPMTLRIALQTAEDYPIEEADFTVVGTKIKGKLSKTSTRHWEGILAVGGLKPGEYKLEASIETGEKQLGSSSVGFFVSYPLYVAWTQDWEGYDVPDIYLSAITQISRDHDLEMTHFWNPRLTVTDTVPQARKDALLTWVKNRQTSFGESIQIHLHMFTDFIKASGVEPKNTPNWGDSGDGYGALTTNYNTDELTKIISKGIEIMTASGLPKPTIYRAGGWFANEDTLEAVGNSGLLADASGRTSYKFFSQTGPWDLPQTAQPYYPSATDKNKAGTPSLGILEIPNNGADSYWFSTEEMKNRFTSNYSGGILSEPRQITYLSHPHWFNKAEQAKIEGVFALIDKYKYDKDSGPTIYVTLDEIYKVWEK